MTSTGLGSNTLFPQYSNTNAPFSIKYKCKYTLISILFKYALREESNTNTHLTPGLDVVHVRKIFTSLKTTKEIILLYILMACCKTMISPVCVQRRYHSLVLSHQFCNATSKINKTRHMATFIYICISQALHKYVNSWGKTQIDDLAQDAQIAKASTSIRYRSDAKVSDQCLINVDPMVFAIWGH